MAGLRAGGITVSLILSGLAHAYVLGSMHWSPRSAAEGEPKTLSLRLHAQATTASPEAVTAPTIEAQPTPVPEVVEKVRVVERQPVAAAQSRVHQPAQAKARTEPRSAPVAVPVPRAVPRHRAEVEAPPRQPPVMAPALADTAPRPRADEVREQALQVAAAAPAPALASGAGDDSGAEAELLRLLNQEIARSRQYPRIARRQGREGTARVAFTLGPDGRISALEIVDSTRFMALDQAALGAVSSIEPFKPASRYLHEARSFRVDVQFALK